MITFRRECTMCLLFVLMLGARAQNWNSMIPYLNEVEKKSVDKALDEITSAGKLIQQANTYNQQALELQNNTGGEMDEKTLEKKMKKSEDDALESQLKADKIYSSAYQSLYKTCRSNYKRTASSQNSAGDSYLRAADSLMNLGGKYRNDAKKAGNSFDKVSKLQDAEGYENAAIDNVVSAILVANGQEVESQEGMGGPEEVTHKKPPEESTLPKPQQSSIQSSGNEGVNYGQITKYQDYVNDSSIPPPLMVNRNGVNGNSDVSLSDAKQIFLNYTAQQPVIPTVDTVSQRDSINQESTGVNTGQDTLSTQPLSSNITAEESTQQKSTISNKINPTAEKTTQRPSSETKKTSSRKAKTSKKISPVVVPKRNINTETPETSIPVSSAPNEVRFAVQVAASRFPLTRTQLQAIYPGNLTVEIVREDNWFKYRIPGFRVFKAAAQIANEAGMGDAWVMATSGGKTSDLVAARKATRNLESDLPGNAYSNNQWPVDYYVQVAASRVRIQKDEITKYCLSDNYREVIEEGWFKYQIYAGNSYDDARSLKQSLNCRSFIVGYRGGKKINL